MITMSVVRPKKSLGQHFLRDQNIARKIVESLDLSGNVNVLEIGPGMGVLTHFLAEIPSIQLSLVEIDRESVEYLRQNLHRKDVRIIEGDFLRLDLSSFVDFPLSVIGNFPYNISSQIFFKILDYRDRVPQVVGMVQKEVADRYCASPGSKTYGILSVLLQAFYHIEYLFTVGEQVFIPPPKVKSAVVRLTRNDRDLPEDEAILLQIIVKAAFNQRRKILGNALKSAGMAAPPELAGMRAEQLTVDQFLSIVRYVKSIKAQDV